MRYENYKRKSSWPYSLVTLLVVVVGKRLNYDKTRDWKMIPIKGDFYEAKYKVDLWCATTNSDKDRNGDLIMGKGTASVMKLHAP